ncbi:hypothetical protein PFNF54_00322 [Plasmodium falciparum NF54]|uniref:Uncharacterized protein n=1 Tax=Plasmodium falciparum (isolate NF54) TaxID=5843 RepID=W7KD11_PLAFO|nr:hypothetical protein PFNF54_00322 [Plasmodium falciparum NF54]
MKYLDHFFYEIHNYNIIGESINKIDYNDIKKKKI